MNYGLFIMLGFLIILSAHQLQESHADTNTSKGGNHLIEEYIKAGIIPPPKTVLLDDNFSSNLNAWTFSSYCGNCELSPIPNKSYSLTLDYSEGISSANIFGDGEYGSGYGMEKTVTMPSNVTKAILSFDGRAQGSLPTHFHIPNLRMDIFDKNNQLLYGAWLIGDKHPSSDAVTNWQNFEINITEYVLDEKEITVFLGLTDHWVADWKQKVWIDNVQLIIESQNPTYSWR